MSPEAKAKIPCSRWCCIGMVVITIVVIILVVKVFQEPGGGSGDALEDKGDSQLTSRRVDRLTFFNISDDPGNPAAPMASAHIDLYANKQAPYVPWGPMPQTDLVAANGQCGTKILDIEFDENETGPMAIRCEVNINGELWECIVKAEEGRWFATATFWYAKTPAGHLSLCGEALQSDGTMQITDGAGKVSGQ